MPPSIFREAILRRASRWLLWAASSLAASFAATAATPTASITLNPSTIVSGAESTVTWSSTNASACTASGNWAWSGALAASGSAATSQTGSSFYVITYAITCTGTGGTATSTAYLSVEPPGAPTVTLGASPASIVAGSPATLTWSSTNATSCTATGGWSGSEATSGQLSVTPASTTTYTLTCAGAASTAQSAATVTVTSATAPTVDLAASPTSIVAGATTTLTWSSTNATACTASGGWSGSESLSGSENVAPLATTTYTLACSGADGTTTNATTVTVTAPPPSVAISATPTAIVAGGSAELAWSSSNATTCTAAGGWSGAEPVSGSLSVSPVGSTTYTLECSGAGGVAVAAASVTVSAGTMPTVTLTAAPTSIVAGGSAKLAWSSTNATACTASGGWSGSEPTSGSVSVTPTATTTYSLACEGAGGSGTGSATVTVNAAPPTVALTATPAGITAGASSTLNWTSANATACTASGGWTGTQPLSGSLAVSPAGTTSYTLTCVGPGGSTPAAVTVSVAPLSQPTVTLAASPSSISSGGSSLLTWSSSNATACTASGGWTGSEAISGKLSVTPAATTTYTLTCTGAGGTAAGSATVTVAASGTPTASISLSPSTIVSGGTSTITWSSTNATACTASGNYSWNGAIALSGTQTTSMSGASYYLVPYTITCTGAGGATATATADLAVSPPGTASLTLTPSPASIGPGGSATLTWSSANVTACTASGGWTGTEPTSGSLQVSPRVTTTYTLTCTGSNGTAQASTTVTVVTPPLPTVSVSASPTTISSGGSSTLTWSSTNATACSASGAWSGSEATSGTQRVSPTLTGVSTYSLSCSGAGGAASASAAVTVYAADQPVAGVNPTSLSFASQVTGTSSPPQVVTLTNSGTGTLAGIAIGTTGDFSDTTACGSTLAANTSCTIDVVFSPTAAGPRTGMLTVASNAADGSASVALAGSGALPVTGTGLPLISPGLPIYASSAAYPVANAIAGNYNNEWRSVGTPATLTLDLSTVPTALRQSIWLVWYNEASYSYDHSLIGEVGYNNPGAYTLSVNAAPGGTAPPTTGWVPVASLSANTKHSYSHHIPFAGYNWVQYDFTAADGSTGNTDIAINLDVYGSSSGVTDGWFFNGDSITANCMSHNQINAQDENDPTSYIVIQTPSFGQQVNAIVGNDTPLQENGGEAGFTSAQMIPYLAGWLANVPSKYVTLSLGSNDAGGGVAPATFYANMATLVQAVISAGKVPVVPTIPYSLDAVHQANIPALNAEIKALYAAYPSIVPGPDLYTFFIDNPQYISTDNLHPNAQGCVAYRTLWANFAASVIYQ